MIFGIGDNERRNEGLTIVVALLVHRGEVVREEAHRVVLGDVLRMKLHELERRLPERLDRLGELKHAQGEA